MISFTWKNLKSFPNYKRLPSTKEQIFEKRFYSKSVIEIFPSFLPVNGQIISWIFEGKFIALNYEKVEKKIVDVDRYEFQRIVRLLFLRVT